MYFFQSLGLPYEVIEMIVQKGVAAVYAQHRAVSPWPRADVTSLITIGSVGSYWYNIVFSSKLIRRTIHYCVNKSKVISHYVLFWHIIITEASTLNQL
jgi:hypothetical protein